MCTIQSIDMRVLPNLCSPQSPLLFSISPPLSNPLLSPSTLSTTLSTLSPTPSPSLHSPFTLSPLFLHSPPLPLYPPSTLSTTPPPSPLHCPSQMPLGRSAFGTLHRRSTSWSTSTSPSVAKSRILCGLLTARGLQSVEREGKSKSLCSVFWDFLTSHGCLIEMGKTLPLTK